MNFQKIKKVAMKILLFLVIAFVLTVIVLVQFTDFFQTLDLTYSGPVT